MEKQQYRVYDSTDREILACGIDDYGQACEALELLRLQYPNNTLELETYTYNTKRAGFGRDPDIG